MTVEKFAEMIGLPNADEYDILEVFLYGYGDVAKSVVGEKIVEQDRWHTYYEAVCLVGGMYYRADWAAGSTEYQEADLNLNIVEVYPHVVTKTEYKTSPQQT